MATVSQNRKARKKAKKQRIKQANKGANKKKKSSSASLRAKKTFKKLSAKKRGNVFGGMAKAGKLRKKVNGKRTGRKGAKV